MKRTLATGLALLLAALVCTVPIGCSGGEQPAKPPSRPASGAAADPANPADPANNVADNQADPAGNPASGGDAAEAGDRLTTEERLDPANRGSVRGVMRFEGAVPPRIEMSAPAKTPGCSQHAD